MEQPTTERYLSDMMSRNALLGALGVGAVVGLIGWLLAIAFDQWVIGAIFCRSSDTASVCVNAWPISWILAHTIVAIGSLFALVRLTVYRPLLVVIAAFVAVWGISAWLLPLAWWQATLWQAGLFALAYALFAWLASIERFLYSLVVTVAVLVIIRLVAAL